MKLDPRKWFRRKEEEPKAVYLTKIVVVVKCSDCPHCGPASVDLGQGTNPVCGATGDKIIEDPSGRPGWCPLSTEVPPHDSLVVWEGQVVRRGG